MNFIDFEIFYFGLFYIILYILFYLFLLKRKNEIIIFLYLIPNIIRVIISLVLIESGMYITEQGVFGYNLYALHYYMLFAFSQIYVFYLFAHKIPIKKLPQKNNIFFFYIFSFIFIVFLIYLNILNPYATRFNIFSASPVIEKIGNILNAFYGATFFYVLFTERRIKYRIIYSILAAVVALLARIEFGSIVIIIESFIITYVIFKPESIKDSHTFTINKGVMLQYAVVLIAIPSIIIYKYLHLGDIIFLINRITLDAHAFWGSIAYNQTYGNVSIPLNIVFETFLLWTPPHASNINIGVGLLMNSIGDPKIIENFIEDNVRFSNCYPSVFILHFGIFIALFLNILFSVIYVYFLKLKFHILSKWNIFIYIIFLKIFYPVDNFIMGGEYMTFNIKFFVYAILFFIFLQMLKDYRRKNV